MINHIRKILERVLHFSTELLSEEIAFLEFSFLSSFLGLNCMNDFID